MKSYFITSIFLFFLLNFQSLHAQSHEISVGIMVGKHVPYSTEKIESNGQSTLIIGDSLRVQTPIRIERWTDKEFYYDGGIEVGYRNIFKLNNSNHLRVASNLSINWFRFSEYFRFSSTAIGTPDTTSYIPPAPVEDPCDNYFIGYDPERFPNDYRSFQQIRLGVGAEWVTKPLTKRLTIGVGPYFFADIYSEAIHHYRQYVQQEWSGILECGYIVTSDRSRGNNIYAPIHLEARANVQFEIFQDFHIQLEWQKQINNVFKKVISGAPTFYEEHRPRRIAVKLVYRVHKDKKESEVKNKEF